MGKKFKKYAWIIPLLGGIIFGCSTMYYFIEEVYLAALPLLLITGFCFHLAASDNKKALSSEVKMEGSPIERN